MDLSKAVSSHLINAPSDFFSNNTFTRLTKIIQNKYNYENVPMFLGFLGF